MHSFETEENFDSKPLVLNTEINSNRVTKPWGYYIDHYRSEKSVLKTIVVNPHSRLSLQSHKKREELWVVLEGEGMVEYDAYPNTSLGRNPDSVVERIRIGSKVKLGFDAEHRLINDTNKPLVVAEVQYGICDEDDIERFEDDYGR